VRRFLVLAALAAAAAAAPAQAPGAEDLLPAKVAQYAQAVESVRGHKFDRAVPATEIDAARLKETLRSKLAESFPASPEETKRTLVGIGMIEDTPNLVDRLVDFYGTQVIAFYDPEPRRFFVVRGAAATLDGEALEGAAEKLIYTHELTHALQDQNLDLDRRIKALKDDGDRALALQCLLEGEATLVMIKAALADLPGADESVEEQIAPLLTAGSLEKANAPKDVPAYFTEQLFFPYAEGTDYVRRTVKKGGWAAVDRLWASPPTSSAEILHPEDPPFAPATNLLPRPETMGPEGARFLYADTLGEWGLRFLLRRGLPSPEADAAAAGWRGDRVAFFAAKGDAIAYVWRIRMDTPEAAGRLLEALARSRKTNASARPEAARREGVDLVVTSGMPGPGGSTGR